MKKIIYILFIVLLSGQIYSQWVQCYGIDSISLIRALNTSGNIVFTGTDWGYGYNSGIYLSTNNGLNWTLDTNGMNIQTVFSLSSNGNKIFAGTLDNGVYLSTSNGLNWTQTSLNNKSVMSLATSENYVFAGTYQGVYLTTNNGLNWIQNGLNNKQVLSLAINGNNIFAGTSWSIYGAMYISTNYGMNWIIDTNGMNNQTVNSITINGNNIFAGTDNGVFLSTNNGLNWTQTSLEYNFIYSIAISGNNIFAGADIGIYLSTNNGTNWVQHNEGFPGNITINSLCIINNYLIAGTMEYGIWRRYIPELIGVNKISSKLPTKFELSQNYPNPFNPSTTIKFTLAEDNIVTLKIYDIIGNELQTILNNNIKAGEYEIKWDGSNLSSGIYLYKLIAGNFSETKKMILIK